MESSYNDAASIAGKIYKELKNKIQSKYILSISELCIYGNLRIVQETNLIHKNITDKGIALPVTISLNNYMNGSPDKSLIKDKDLVKIELAVSINGYIAILGETFIAGLDNQSLEIQKSIDFLHSLQHDIINTIKHGETNDEVRIMIESKSTNHSLFPIENCTSYQQFQNNPITIDSKFMILNYKDTIDSNENTCFEFEKNEVYDINLSMIPIFDDSLNIKYSNAEEPTIYRFNDYKYQLKLKSSREFYSNVKNIHKNYFFDIKKYNSNVKHRIGIKECFDNGILDKINIQSISSNKLHIPIICKKFTIIVKDKKSYLLKY